MIFRIDSRSNPKLKSLLSARDEYAMFEGEKLVRDILKMKIRISILILLHEESQLDLNRLQVDEVWSVSRPVMNKISSLKNIPPFIAMIKYRPRELNLADAELVLALDGIQDPANAGTIFRCAAAFGVSAIFLTKDCVSPTNGKFLRTAQTSALSIPFQRVDSLQSVIKTCENNHLGLYLTTADSKQKSTPVDKICLPACIVLGSEGRGLPKNLFGKYPTIHVSQSDRVESLNVGVSACIILNIIYNRGKQ